MTRFNAWNVIKNGFTGQKNWDRQWRDPEPKKEYDIIIVGGGLHGLATAYYLAKNHNKKNIAVLEKGWVGGGNAGRNTTIVRSNYMMPGNHEFYEHSLKLWENLSHDLNYNVMFSQRAHVSLFHSPSARDGAARRYNIMRLHGTDAELWDLDELQKNIPHLNYEDARFPILGAAVQRRAGNARHDSTVWGFARAADSLGVDILQNCEVTGITRKQNAIESIETSRGAIKAKKIGYNPKIILAGRNMNDEMDTYVLNEFVKEMKKKSIKLNKSKVLILGLTFKENCPDIRNSKIINLIKGLSRLGCITKVYDPYLMNLKYVNKTKVNIVKTLKPNSYDGIIIAVKHNKFIKMGSKYIRELGKSNHVLYDIRYTFKKKEIEFRL